MKKYIMAVVIAVCLALCAAVWPRYEEVEETPKLTQATAVNTPETPVVTEVQPTPEPKTTPEPAPDSIPAQTVIDSQPSDMVYVPGFGWLESQGEGTVIHDDMMYENGNKIGIMGSSE